jgi:hypothetical protein
MHTPIELEIFQLYFTLTYCLGILPDSTMPEHLITEILHLSRSRLAEAQSQTNSKPTKTTETNREKKEKAGEAETVTQGTEKNEAEKDRGSRC